MYDGEFKWFCQWIKIDCKRGEYRVQTNCHISNIGTGLGLGSESRPIAISTMQSSAVRYLPIIQRVHHINLGREIPKIIAMTISFNGE